ncbi:Aste57867_140 [Aphanomyces stellatus]|uniref:Aste57867_140 protein n=1 Tax=Aphanomyces stellatus TaxID=120398 RepID=A0A485K5Z8_9STRA|nr:hypothetical protein As57867_000140 [Aphanomyces stellatus]VFT77366.1 Aste57867_140 [Aphanomyces stellatus]
MTEPLLCKYAYKQCMNTRVTKRDGELHRLCEYHRDKANALQKVYATKRRRELRAQKRQDMVDKNLSEIEPMPFSPNEMTGRMDELACLFDELRGVFADGESLSDEEYAYLLRQSSCTTP